MESMTRYSNAFVEVYTILSYLEKEDYAKIPSTIIIAIKENMNQDYEYEMNEDIDLEKQEMMPETRAILFNLFRDYLSTDEQREKIKRMQQEDLMILRKNKNSNINLKAKNKYDSNININNINDTNIKDQSINMQKINEELKISSVIRIDNKDEELALVKGENESIIRKIINKIKGMFR